MLPNEHSAQWGDAHAVFPPWHSGLTRACKREHTQQDQTFTEKIAYVLLYVSVFLKALYKLRTKKIFKKEEDGEVQDEDPFQITHLSLCPESRVLVTANTSSALIICKLNTQEAQSEITV